MEKRCSEKEKRCYVDRREVDGEEVAMPRGWRDFVPPGEEDEEKKKKKKDEEKKKLKKKRKKKN